MNISKKAMAVGLCAALGSATLVVPTANAVVTVEKQTAKVDTRSGGKWDPFITGQLRLDGSGVLRYDHPEALIPSHGFTLAANVYVNGKKLPIDPNVKPQVRTEDSGQDVVWYTQTFGNVEVTREFKLAGDRVDVSVSAANRGSAPAVIKVDVVNQLANAAGMKASVEGATQIVQPESRGYVTAFGASGANSIGVGSTEEQALTRTPSGGAPSYQGARWNRTVGAGQQLVAKAAVQFAPQRTAFDQDGDGLRDTWEAEGLTLRNGEQLPIHRWGASQTVPDLFLQLNWMKSEWETLGCDRASQFEATAAGFTKFAECAMANTKDYEPSPRILKELEDNFKANGVNLHIDAGDHYVSSSMVGLKEPKGGKTEDYKKFYFGDDNASRVLLADTERLLGDRKAVFRVGVIGDQMKEGDFSTGSGITNGSAFFVANHEGMTTQDQLRNTILHEFGHNLGLGHYGAYTANNSAPAVNNLEAYKSVMSYAHQLTYNDYMKDDLNEAFFIPSDWANLNYPGMNVGRGSVTIGVDEEAKDLSGHSLEKKGTIHDEPEADELIENAADTNKGVASFRLKTTPDGENGIVSQLGKDNEVIGELRNLGSTTDTFKVQVDYGTGTYTETVKLTPVKTASSRKTMEIVLDKAALIDNPVVPLNVTVTNSAGKQVFQDTFRLSALNYSEAEMERVLSEIRKSSADPKIKAFAEQKLKVQPKPVQSSTAKPAPAPAAPVQQPQAPAPKDEGSSASPIAIVLGVLLALGGIGAAAFGWAKSQGMI